MNVPSTKDTIGCVDEPKQPEVPKIKPKTDNDGKEGR
jgi:hypothetical protein